MTSELKQKLEELKKQRQEFEEEAQLKKQIQEEEQKIYAAKNHDKIEKVKKVTGIFKAVANSLGNMADAIVQDAAKSHPDKKKKEAKNVF